PISPYAETKKAGELSCARYHEKHAASVAVLRFFSVYGPRQRPDLAARKLGTLMLQGRPVPVYGNGGSERDYTWVDDIIDGVVSAIAWTRKAPGGHEIINLGGGQATPLSRLIELLASALDVEPRIERCPMQPGDVERTCADIRKAGRLLDYVPRVSLQEGLGRFAKWLTASKPLTYRTHGKGTRTRPAASSPG